MSFLKISPDFFPSAKTGFFAASSGSKKPAFVGVEVAAKNASNSPSEKSGNSCSGVTRSQSAPNCRFSTCRSVSY